MIKKIEMPEMDETYKSAMFAKVLGNKINELVDVVNVLIKENNIHEKQIDELQVKVEPEECETPAEKVPEPIKLYVCADGSVYDNLDIAKSHAARAENVQDRFAEQCKWRGKFASFGMIEKTQKIVYMVYYAMFLTYTPMIVRFNAETGYGTNTANLYQKI